MKSYLVKIGFGLVVLFLSVALRQDLAGHRPLSENQAMQIYVGNSKGNCCDADCEPATSCDGFEQLKCNAPPVGCIDGEVVGTTKPDSACCKPKLDQNAKCFPIDGMGEARTCRVIDDQPRDCVILNPDGTESEGQICPFTPEATMVPTKICGSGSTFCYCHFIDELDIDPQLRDRLWELCLAIEDEAGI